MGDIRVLGPLELTFGDQEVLFRFADPGAMMLEIPGQLEVTLRTLTEERAASFTGRKMVVDLENLRTLTSRQLGILLMLRTVCEPYGGIVLRNLAEPVLGLLHLTKVAKLFKAETSERE